MRCVLDGTPYTVFGYKGKQVRDNIHSHDLVNALWHVFEKPPIAAVYNMGGGRKSNCSMLEAIKLCEKISGRSLNWNYSDQNRAGDHIWWISDTRRLQRDCPGWKQRYDLETMLKEIHDGMAERLGAVKSS